MQTELALRPGLSGGTRAGSRMPPRLAVQDGPESSWIDTQKRDTVPASKRCGRIAIDRTSGLHLIFITVSTAAGEARDGQLRWTSTSQGSRSISLFGHHFLIRGGRLVRQDWCHLCAMRFSQGSTFTSCCVGINRDPTRDGLTKYLVFELRSSYTKVNPYMVSRLSSQSASPMYLEKGPWGSVHDRRD